MWRSFIQIKNEQLLILEMFSFVCQIVNQLKFRLLDINIKDATPLIY